MTPRTGDRPHTFRALLYVSVEGKPTAIKFVDIEPEGAGKPEKKADAPPLAHEPEAERPGVSPLPYAKPAPKKRGRK